MTSQRNVLLMVAFVACGSAGKPAPSNTCDVPTKPAELEAFLKNGDYLRWPAEPAAHASKGPHGTVRTFLNPLADAALRKGAPFNNPVCSAAVKELYEGGVVTGYAVEVKVEAESKAGEGWYWYERLNGGRVVADGVGAGLCTGCHSEGGADFIKTTSL